MGAYYFNVDSRFWECEECGDTSNRKESITHDKYCSQFKRYPKAKWFGSVPTICDLCKEPIGEFFVDGFVRGARWAILCEDCHKVDGIGLGTGRGQKYSTRTLEKVAG